MQRLNVGVVGYSGQKFNKGVASKLISSAFDKVDDILKIEKSAEGNDVAVWVISGLTDLGIPALAYREAEARGWKTSGIACELAKDYDCYNVDEEIIEGLEWGDESDTFLDAIDVIIRVGGGDQSLAEVERAKEMGKVAYEYELEAEEK